jgi:large subunit ribosomal protein L2
VGKRKSGGRNNHGHLVNSRIGGGHKRRIRIIDFKRRKFDMPATVERLEYDPNRTAFIALIRYEDGEQSYILAPQRLRVGDQVVAGERADIKPGNALPLKNIPVGTIIHNVELKPMKGGQLARAAGTYVQLVGRDIDYALLRLGSGEVRKVHLDCLATIGAVSNPDQQNIIIGKAGRSRWFGIRPHTRGIAKNPVDHPHGGRTNGGKHWVTPSGISTKGKKTRQNKRTDGMILRRRHAAK